MAMNQPPPMLVGPGGVPLQMTSNWVCPTCKHRPPVANNPEFPAGTPVCMITAEPGETTPTFNCLMCWNKFWARFVRRHAPELQVVPLVGASDDETDDAEEDV